MHEYTVDLDMELAVDGETLPATFSQLERFGTILAEIAGEMGPAAGIHDGRLGVTLTLDAPNVKEAVDRATEVATSAFLAAIGAKKVRRKPQISRLSVDAARKELVPA